MSQTRPSKPKSSSARATCRWSSTSGQLGAGRAARSLRQSSSEVEKRTGKVALTKINVDAEQELAARYGIQSIPTVAVFRDGEPVTGFVGAHPASAIGHFLDEVIEKHGEEVEVA